MVPAGEWYVETDTPLFDAHVFLGIVGKPFARLVVNDDAVDSVLQVGEIDDSLPHAQRTVMRNLQIDIRNVTDAAIGRWYPWRWAEIENVDVRGQRDRYGGMGTRQTLLVDGINEFTTSVIRNVRLPSGDTYYSNQERAGHAIGFSSEWPHRGTNIWENCYVNGFQDNGFYVARNHSTEEIQGRNVLIGCRAVNNSGGNIRLGKNDMALDCEIVMDDPNRHSWTGLFLNHHDGQVVDGLRIRNTIGGAGSDVGELVRCAQSGSAHVRNVHVESTADDGVRSIRVSDSDDERTVLENVVVRDEKTSGYSVHVRSDNVTFRNCEFTFPYCHGIAVNGSAPQDAIDIEGCEFHDSATADLRFYENGSDHNVTDNRFGNEVWWSGATLSDVLWTGNRHDAGFNRGASTGWNIDNNWNGP